MSNISLKFTKKQSLLNKLKIIHVKETVNDYGISQSFIRYPFKEGTRTIQTNCSKKRLQQLVTCSELTGNIEKRIVPRHSDDGFFVRILVQRFRFNEIL